MGFSPGLVTLGLLAAAYAGSVAAPAQAQVEPEPARTSTNARPVEPTIPIFLDAPADRESPWTMLGRPDLMALDGEPYLTPRPAARQAPAPAQSPPSGVVGSLAVTGRIAGDWARLTVEYRVTLESEGPAWVPIHLDGLALSEAREGARDLPSRVTEGRAWQVELKGKGDHVVRVGLFAPIRATPEGRRLDLAIPPAASTRFDLIAPRMVFDAACGPDEVVAITPEVGTSEVRLSARLVPRPRIGLAWRERAEPPGGRPCVLSARGEMAIVVERGSIRTRGTWLVTALRGAADRLTLGLDPSEEVLAVEVDGNAVQAEARREGGRLALTVVPPEPLRAGSSLGLTWATRRPIAPTGTVRVQLQGGSIDQATVQSGVLAIAKVGPLFLDPTPGRGLRRVDPKADLPEGLRDRPEAVLAFEFDDPPFELGLGIEPAPPRLRVENSSTIILDPRTARLQTRLDCRTSQGRLFEVQVVLPEGLEFEGAGPASVVESSQVRGMDPMASTDPGAGSRRTLTMALTPQAREAEAFTIVLRGRSPVDPSGPLSLPLFRPAADSTGGARFAVLTDRNVFADLASTADVPSAFRVDRGRPPADWAWPGRRPGPDQDVLWLRSEANPEALPLRADVRPRSIRHESSTSVAVDRRGAEVVDEISGEVAFGTLSRLDIAVPREPADRWEVEGAERTTRELLGIEGDGTRRYRLKFAREFTDAFRVRIRYRIPFADPSPADREGRLRLAPIRALEGTSTGHRISISAGPGIGLVAEGRGWSATAPDVPTADPGPGPPARVTLARSSEDAGAVAVAVRFGPPLPLPGLVVSRLLLRSSQRPEGDLATTASFRVESREGEMTVGLPPGSRPLRARVGSIELGEGEVERGSPDEYRLRFPASTPPGPAVVTFDYEVPAWATSGGWPAPRLLGGGVVQQTLWEVQVLGTRAGVGTPSGWVDENGWARDGLLWRRRPWRTEAEIAGWPTAGDARPRPDDPTPRVDPAGPPRYLFSRAGAPGPLRFVVLARLGLLLLCSGPALAAGLLVLSRRPPPRPLAGSLLVAGFAAGSIVEPDVLFLALQSSSLGIALFVMALAIHWAVERRGHAGARGDRALLIGAASIGATDVPAPSVGSDDSTAIRARPPGPLAASTADHVVLGPSALSNPAGASPPGRQLP